VKTKLFLLATLTAAAALAADTLPRIDTLKFPPMREVKIPNVTTFRLPNGMRVYMLENHELPLVSGTALVRTGNLFDPPDKVGLASLTGTVFGVAAQKPIPATNSTPCLNPWPPALKQASERAAGQSRSVR